MTRYNFALTGAAINPVVTEGYDQWLGPFSQSLSPNSNPNSLHFPHALMRCGPEWLSGRSSVESLRRRGWLVASQRNLRTRCLAKQTTVQRISKERAMSPRGAQQ